MKSVATHNGSFHADEVLAVAILKSLYPKIKVIRTRDPEEYNQASLRVDVSGRFDPKKGDFDHHQDSFTKKRKNGIPYSSAGLIWIYFGKKLTKSKEAWSYIDNALIKPIDANDNGVDYYTSGKAKPFAFENIIGSFKPVWNDKNQDFDLAFNNAVSFSQTLLKSLISFANGLTTSKEIVKQAIKKSNKPYIFLRKPLPPWEDALSGKSPKKFVIYKYSDNKWCAKGAPIKKGSFKVKKAFPLKWRGLLNKDLVKISGIKDAVFCHKTGFMVIAESKESILKMIEIALKNKQL